MEAIKTMMSLRSFLFVMVLFCLTLFWVEASPWSSKALAENNDYGTFDMKKYDSETVYKVLEHTDEEGLQIYRRYIGNC